MTDLIMEGKRTVRKPVRRLLLFGLKLSVAGILLYWLLSSGRLDLKTFTQVEIGWTLLGIVLCLVLTLCLQLARWFLLVRSRRLDLPPWTAARIGMIGLFASIFIPAGLGMEGVRFVGVSRLNRGRGADVLSTLVMDRLLGLMVLVLMSLIASVIYLCYRFDIVVLRIAIFGASLLLALSLGLLAILKIRSKKWLGPLKNWSVVVDITRALSRYRGDGKVIVWALLLSLSGQICTLVAAALAFSVLKFPAPFLSVCAITPLVNLSSAIPLTPLGLGVADSVASVLYASLGIGGGAETTMLLRIVGVGIAALGVAALVMPGGGAKVMFPKSSTNEINAGETTSVESVESSM